jgi:hypothetical protein
MTSWYLFDKYYAKTSDSSVYAAALLLHPSFRLQYIQDNWDESWREPALTAARSLWKEQYATRPVDKLQTSGTERSSTATSAEPSAFDLAMDQMKLATPVEDEFELFIKQAQSTLPASTTALEWWLDPARKKDYPRLYYMAVDILSIPAMSAEPERIFSGARRTVTWTRFCLGSSAIERSECLKSWIRTKVTIIEQLLFTEVGSGEVQ